MALTRSRRATAEPRKATDSERQTLVDLVTVAFFDDPVMGWMWPEPEVRRQILPDLFELFVVGSLAHDEAYTFDDVAGTALWMPPVEITAEEQEAFLAGVTAATHGHADRLLQALELLDVHHPHEPHYYLPIIAVRPERQGQGLGSRLFEPVLRRCDLGDHRAYLEATGPRNRDLYLRHGFAVKSEVPLPDGPTMYAMVREPRTL